MGIDCWNGLYDACEPFGACCCCCWIWKDGLDPNGEVPKGEVEDIAGIVFAC